jgi:diguanylate cyclase
LSLYAIDLNGFSDDHRRIIEVAAGQIAPSLSRAIEFEKSILSDSVTRLPHLDQVATLVHSMYQADQGVTQRFALVFIDVLGMTQIIHERGRAAGDDVLRHVVRHTRAALRLADVLFRNTSDEFVAFLGVADAETTEIVAARIREAIVRHPIAIPDGVPFTVHANVTALVSPNDGTSLHALLALAKERGTSSAAGRNASSKR